MPISSITSMMLRMERIALRVTMSAVVLIGGFARLAGNASYGFYKGSTIMLLAIGLPLVIVGSWLGDRLARWLSIRTFSRVVGVLVLLSGVALLLK